MTLLRVMQGARFEARRHQPLEIVNVRDKNASQIGSLLAPCVLPPSHDKAAASRKYFPRLSPAVHISFAGVVAGPRLMVVQLGYREYVV